MRHLTRLFTSLLALTVTACVQVPLSNERQCEQQTSPIVVAAPLPDRVWQRLDAAPRSNPVRQDEVLAYFEHCKQLSVQRVSRRQKNIVCRIPGNSSRAYVVGAHHDRFGPGGGVADNWTGITLAAELITYLQSQELQHTWLVVAFADEETGMAGSRTFVSDLQDPVVGYLNVDTVGTGPVSLDKRSSAHLTCTAREVSAALGGPIRETRITESVSDWVPFQKQGIDFLAVHSLNRRQTLQLHTRKDNLSMVQQHYLLEAWQFLLSLSQTLDHHQK